MNISLGVELGVVLEGQQVHRGEIAGGVVEKHVFRARVGAADSTILRAGVPGVDGVVELNPRISTGPGGMADLVPQLAGRGGLGYLAIGAADQLPRAVILDRLQERIGHPDRIVGVLARHRNISLGIPIGIVDRKFDAVEALFGILQDAVGVGVRDHRLFSGLDRGFQCGVLQGINGILGTAIPSPDRRKNVIQPRLMRFGTGHQ